MITQPPARRRRPKGSTSWLLPTHPSSLTEPRESFVRLLWPASSGSLLLLLGGLACRESPEALTVDRAGAQTPAQVQSVQTAVDASRRTALVTATDRVAPAVVSINVTRS